MLCRSERATPRLRYSGATHSVSSSLPLPGRSGAVRRTAAKPTMVSWGDVDAVIVEGGEGGSVRFTNEELMTAKYESTASPSLRWKTCSRSCRLILSDSVAEGEVGEGGEGEGEGRGGFTEG